MKHTNLCIYKHRAIRQEFELTHKDFQPTSVGHIQSVSSSYIFHKPSQVHVNYQLVNYVPIPLQSV